MAIDYRLLTGFGNLGPQLPDPMSLASMRLGIDRQRLAMDQALEEQQRQRSLRALMPQAFTPEGGINQNVARQIVGMGGASELRAAQQAMMPSDVGKYQKGALVGVNPETGSPEFVQFSEFGEPKFTGISPVIKQEAPKAPTTRTVERDGMKIAEEFDAASGQWKEVGRTKIPSESGATQKAADSMRKLDTVSYAVDTYDRLIDRKGVKPFDAELDAAYTQLAMEVKNLAELGALSGPDLALIQSMLTPPTSPKGQIYGAAKLKQQNQLIRDRIEFAKKNLMGGREAGDVKGISDIPSAGKGNRPPLDKLIKVK